MTALALCAAVAIDNASDAAPAWLHLLPAGDVRTHDGRGPYRVTDAHGLIAASMAAGKLVLDENHATDLAAPKGLPAPAQGWIVQLQQRADGIWGRVEWTEAAKRAETWRSYRGVSPAIVHLTDGRVVSIARASLTNTPNLAGLTALHRMERNMDLRLRIIDLLGLPSAADDTMIEDKIKLLVGRRDTGKIATHSNVEVQRMALQARVYQADMAKLGVNMNIAEAVHAVHDGKTA